MPIYIFSLLFNVMIVASLSRVKESSPSLDMILRHLSLYDMAVTILSLLHLCIPTLMKYNDIGPRYLHQIYPFMVPYLIPLLHMAITGCDYLNVAIVAERYLAIDRYYQNNKSVHQGCPRTQTKYYIFGIQLLTIAFNIPGFWELATIATVENELQSHGSASFEVNYEVVATCLRHHEVYETMYRLTAELLIFKVTPWMIFLVLFLTIWGRIG